MNYIFLLYGDEANDPDPQADPEAFAAMMAPWEEYTRALTEAGVMRGGDALQPSTTATVVTRRDGRVLHTDGPFAASKEQLGGYYLVACDNLDEALKWAAKCPAAADGRVEVRPIAEMEF